jgi:DNA mismatch repair ATPase MutS
MKKNLIITGPNAAGKTTILKTTLFNILLSQQIGYGFYKSAKINPYDYIHCYINIPDTSGRDSLFQAEARRCKDILDCIEENPKKRHFCVFDELYSGTNPYEAIASAYSYLNFMNSNKNVNYILTTHYIDLCLKIERHDKQLTNNYHMDIDLKDNDFVYKYKLKEGISEIKGGIKVLKELNYPKSLIKLTESIIENSLSI